MFTIFEKENIATWATVAGISTLVFYFVITVAMRIYYLNFDKRKDEKTVEEVAKSFVYGPENFFNSVMELIVTNTCILGVGYIYGRVANTFEILSEWMGLILLVLIVIAIVCNNLIDKYWLNKWWIEGNVYRKDNLRLVSSLSVLAIILIVSILFKSRENFQFALCMAGLVLGRFIYFDSSVNGFINEVRAIFKCWPCFLVAMALMGVLIGTGIAYQIIEPNNAVETLFIAHVFYLIVTQVCMKIWEDIVH